MRLPQSTTASSIWPAPCPQILRSPTQISSSSSKLAGTPTVRNAVTAGSSNIRKSLPLAAGTARAARQIWKKSWPCQDRPDHLRPSGARRAGRSAGRVLVDLVDPAVVADADVRGDRPGERERRASPLIPVGDPVPQWSVNAAASFAEVDHTQRLNHRRSRSASASSISSMMSQTRKVIVTCRLCSIG